MRSPCHPNHEGVAGVEGVAEVEVEGGDGDADGVAAVVAAGDGAEAEAGDPRKSKRRMQPSRSK